MKNILNRLINYESFDTTEAKQILMDISRGKYNDSQTASFLTIFMMRSVTVKELLGFQQALLELCIPVKLNTKNVIDLCGTGGDGKNTFNISTLSSFVVAGAGVKVAKHGNYGVSSISGSSNVLEALGVTFTDQTAVLQKTLDETNICVMHAPLFHPTMKRVAPIRKALGIKTFFNMLGPMVNPAFPKFQMVGVFSLELQRLYSYLYQKTNKIYSIVHALDGYDEISLTGATRIISNHNEVILTPQNIGFSQTEAPDLYAGNSVKDAVAIFKKIINGKGTKAQNSVVLANAGLAISTYKDISYEEGIAQAKVSLKSGKAKDCLTKLITLTQHL